MGLLVRPEYCALTDLRDHRTLGRDLPELTFEIVRRLTGPDLQHHVDALDEHGIAVFSEVAEHFGVRHQSAWTDAHDEATFQHVVDHRHLRGDGRGMTVRHIDRAA